MFTREKALDLTILLLRIAAAVIFIQAGGLKVLGWFGGMPPGSLSPLLATAGWIEVIGGILILLGLFTRPIAFIVSGEMAFAFFIGHVSRAGAFWPIQNHGEPAFLLCFIFLFIAAYGAGRWSLDRVIHNRKTTTVQTGV